MRKIVVKDETLDNTGFVNAMSDKKAALNKMLEMSEPMI